MTAPNSPTEHEKSDFFEEVERAMVKLTTAKLEASAPFVRPAAILPAQAGTATPRATGAADAPAATQPGARFRPAPQ